MKPLLYLFLIIFISNSFSSQTYNDSIALKELNLTKEIEAKLLEVNNGISLAKYYAKNNQLKKARSYAHYLHPFISEIALLLMIFTVVLALRKTKSQKNKIDILHRELHHRTKNNLAIISSFVKEAQQSSTSSKVSTDKLDSLQARITSIYEIHPLMSTLMV